jgi:hypothetical protein
MSKPKKVVVDRVIKTTTGQYFKPGKSGAKAAIKRATIRGVQVVKHIAPFFIPGGKAIKGAKAAHRAYNMGARGLASGAKNKLSSARSAFTNLFGGKVQ